MTTLKEFVSETLTQVTEALLEFEEKGLGKEKAISPFPKLSAKNPGDFPVAISKQQGSTAQYIHAVMPFEFDIAVSASNEEGDKIGGGLKVLEFFNASADTEVKSVNSTVSRVKFKIPLQLARTDRI